MRGPSRPGFRVGRQLVERYTWDRPRIGTDLDAIKFICKDFWVELFRKQARPQPSLCDYSVCVELGAEGMLAA